MAASLNMQLIINGDSHEMPAPLTVQGLLSRLGFGLKPVVVELNQRALFPRAFNQEALNEGDRVEIVQITAGG